MRGVPALVRPSSSRPHSNTHRDPLATPENRVSMAPGGWGHDNPRARLLYLSLRGPPGSTISRAMEAVEPVVQNTQGICSPANEPCRLGSGPADVTGTLSSHG